MNLIGRYTRMRQWNFPSGEVSAPLILDRGKSQADPRIVAAGGWEWWKSPSGLSYQIKEVLRDQAGMAGFRGGVNHNPLSIGETPDNMGNSAALTNINLDSAYTNNSAGDAIATRYLCTRSQTLNDLYFHIASYTGTAANVNDINWEVRSGTESAPTSGGGGLLASGSIDPASATGWIHITSISQAFSAGSVYWLIITDADGNGSDFAVVGQRGGLSWTGGNSSNAVFNSACSTTNGFVSTTRNQSAGKIIGIFSDGTAVGNSLTTTELPTSNTNDKGLYIDALTEQIGFLGFTYDINSTISNIYVWEGATGPSGSPAASGTLATSLGSTNWRGIFLSAPYTLLKSTVYRIVAHSGSNHTIPRRGVVGTGVDANLMKCFWGQGAWYYTEANSTTNWANDVTTKFPLMGLYFEDTVVVTPPATGGGSLVGSGNLVG